MRANHIQRIIHVSVLSMFLALMACSFLAFGSASAHAATQTASSNSSIVARIIDNQQSGFVFSPNAITVTSGTPVRIVNKTPFAVFFHETSNGRLLHLFSGASLPRNPSKSFSAVTGNR